MYFTYSLREHGIDHRFSKLTSSPKKLTSQAPVATYPPPPSRRATKLLELLLQLLKPGALGLEVLMNEEYRV